MQNIGNKVLATWLDGIRNIKDRYSDKCTQSRLPSYKVELKILTRSQNSLKEVSLYYFIISDM
jgi:hypothetical protein